ncbi:MAG: B12-binding domain-containing radical SAM protein [Candidatus Omnitrophica bacterium]|nr:B12-binding domain-containing radical SAM protein [Candidatus Omnitrophota bacterium]
MPPLSILYLASYMEKCGYTPAIYSLDTFAQLGGMFYFGYNLENLFKQIKEMKPQMIGITCVFSSRWPFTQRLTQVIKKAFPDIPLVIGGIHPTTFPEHCLTSSSADYLIIGEGEESVIELFKHILANTKPYGVDGIVFKDEDRLYVNEKKHFIPDLDQIPFPAFHLVDEKTYHAIRTQDRISQFKGLYFPLLTSRSCPNQCTFCNMYLCHGKQWRSRSAENVLAEIDYLSDKYKCRQFAIVDDNFSLSRTRTIAILDGIIAMNKDIRLITPNGLSVSTLDDEVVKKFKRAGALEICIAIESGNEEIRNVVYNKRIKTEKVYEVADACKRHGLSLRTFFMVGAPGESDSTIDESIQMMRRLRVPTYINITTPYKGTQLYDYYIEKGMIKKEDVEAGFSVDLRLPAEQLANYENIIIWRRRLQIANIRYSWPELLRSPGFLNLNSLARLISGIIFPAKITHERINFVLDKYLSLKNS